MIMILLVLAVLMLVGALPTWSHSRSWGYGPSGGLGLILVILLILVLSGRLQARYASACGGPSSARVIDARLISRETPRDGAREYVSARHQLAR